MKNSPIAQPHNLSQANRAQQLPKRLSHYIISLFFKDEEIERLHKSSSTFMNMNCFGPKKAIINGILGDWEINTADVNSNDKLDSFYDSTKKELTIGDFRILVDFLIINAGKTEKSI